MGDFIWTIFVFIFVWILSGSMVYYIEKDTWTNKINTWAIENNHAEYDNKTGEIIYFLENFEEIFE